jgi:hypothetical protein
LTPITFSTSSMQQTYSPAPFETPASTTSDTPADSLHLSLAALREVTLTGRVAMNLADGNITSDQAGQLGGQVSSIQSQIAADLQADGGTLSPTDAQAIQQLQDQVSQTIYGDTHNGATLPPPATWSKAENRGDVEAGRIAMDETAGSISSDQAQQLDSQLSTIHQQMVTDMQANGGTLTPAEAQAINQLQSQLSQQISHAAHGGQS